MQSYQTARSVYSFLGFLAWCVIILGVIVALGGGTATQAIGRNASLIQFFLGAAPGILMFLAGIYGLAMVQMGRTGVDGAEYAQQSLDVSRQQLEISKQMLAQNKTSAASYSAAPASPSTTAPKSDPATEPSVSYANKPDGQAQPPAAPAAEQLPKEGTETPAPAQIAQPQQAALPPPSTDITYKNGEFIVGRYAFKTKGGALEHQKELLAIPRGQ